jgi:uncharacterized protein (TIGR02271 family)
MRDAGTFEVIGRDGLKGTLVDPVPSKTSGAPVRVRLDRGPTIEVPASMLERDRDGTYHIPLGPADFEQDQTVVPVLAEELVVDKEAVPTGGIRVHRRVQEHDEVVDLPLLKEHVDVRRVIVDREVEGPLPVRREGDTTIVPIVEEVLVISKRFVLREEVHITRTVHEERHQERVTLKRHEAEIEEVDSGGRGRRIEPRAERAAEPPPRPRKRRSVLD